MEADKGERERIKSLVNEWKPENIPLSTYNKPEVLWTGPVLHSANKSAGSTEALRMVHNVPKKKKKAALKKAPQIAHYKMIIAHIHVLLCFRK